MGRSSRDNTVSSALHREYLVAVSIVILVFVCFLSLNEMISRMYTAATEHLRAINQLESTFIEMNNAVNVSYNFLSRERVADYENVASQLRREVHALENESRSDYARDVVDLLNTLETFAEESDTLVAMIGNYIAHDTENSVTEEQLAASYQSLQNVYGYTVLRFQDSYSAQLTHYSETQGRLNQLRTMLTIIIGCFLIIMILWFVRETRHMTRKITGAVDTLQEGVAEIERDIETFQPITIQSYAEFNRLAVAYNRMHTMILSQMHKIQENAGIKERLVQSENQNLRLYAEMQRNHLDFLQSRINPHFLFNALNMISSMARIEGADRSAELMETTAQFLRYNLDNISKTMTLRDELRNLEDYIEIQKCRYDDRYTFEYDIDNACLAQEMPCMILQPLVENAIQHGVGMKVRGGIVRVHTQRCDDHVVIEVYDNGVGMTDEQIADVKLDLRKSQTESSHIGIRNIYRRLELFYQGQVELDIRRENPGVTIQLTIPYTDASGRAARAREGAS